MSYDINFEGGTNGATVTTGGSIASITGTPVYTTATFSEGAVAMLASNSTGTSCIRSVQVTPTTHTLAFDLLRDSAISVDTRFLSFGNLANSTTVTNLKFKAATNFITITNASTTDMVSTSNAVPLNTWTRIEIQFDNTDSAAPIVTMRYYADKNAAAGSFTEEITWTLTGTVNVFERHNFGIIGGGSGTRAFYFDNIRCRDGLSWIGPPVTSVDKIGNDTWAMVISEARQNSVFVSRSDTSALVATEGSGGSGTVAFRSFATSGATAQASNVSVNVPAGAAIGDIAVYVIDMDQTGDTPGVDVPVTWPSGFTQKISLGQGEMKQKVAWKRLIAADTGTYQATWTGSRWRMAHVVLLSGCVATGDPFETFNTAVGSANPVPSVSVTTANKSGLLYIVTNLNSSTISGTPAGYTTIIDAVYNRIYFKMQSAAGTETVSGANLSNSSTPRAASLLALIPAGGLAGQVAAGITGTDTSAITVSDSRSISSQLSRTDASALSVTESRQQDVSLTRTESSALSIAESRSMVALLTRTETGSLAISESMLLSNFLQALDVGSIAIAEDNGQLVEVARTDSFTISISEASNLGDQQMLRVHWDGVWHTGLLQIYMDGVWYPVTINFRKDNAWS